MIIHLEPDSLECEATWALGSITANKVSGGDGIIAELFQILKDDAVKVLHSIRQQKRLSSGHRTGKGQFSFQSQRKAMPKNVQNTAITVSSHVSEVMLKILQGRLQQYVNHELPDVQAGFRKGRGTRDQIANICWIIKKAREFQRTSTSASLTMPMPLSMWITTNGENSSRDEYQTTLPVFLEICLQFKKQQLELDMEQQTGSKLGKEYIKAVYCHPAYLTYMQSISCEMPGWMKYKLESKLPGEISITSDIQMTPPLWQKATKN